MASKFAAAALVSSSIFVIPLWTASPPAALKTFRSKFGGYTIHYPGSWHRNSTRLTDTFDIQNFPPSKAVHAVYIPRGGAEIEIAPWRTAPGGENERETIEGWIKDDTAHQKVVTKRTFQLQMLNGNETAVEVREVNGDSEAVIWYFPFEGTWFKALLIYWEGDPNVDKYLQTMRQTVLSLKLSPNHEQTKHSENAK